MIAPVLAAITAFCWSTAGAPTVVSVTLMMAGVVGLLVWDFEKWYGLLRAHDAPVPSPSTRAKPPIEFTLWERCGAAIYVFYLGTCLWYGGVYRPKQVELDNPAFYVLPVLALFPVVTLFLDSAKRR